MDANKEVVALGRTFSSRGFAEFEVNAVKTGLKQLIVKLSQFSNNDVTLQSAIAVCVTALETQDEHRLGELTGELKEYQESLLNFKPFQYELRQPALLAGGNDSKNPDASGWAGAAVMLSMTLEIALICVRRYRNEM